MLAASLNMTQPVHYTILYYTILRDSTGQYNGYEYTTDLGQNGTLSFCRAVELRAISGPVFVIILPIN